MGGVTNLVHRLAPVSPQREVVGFIDVEESPQSSSSHPSDTTHEFLEVSQTKRELLA